MSVALSSLVGCLSVSWAGCMHGCVSFCLCVCLLYVIGVLSVNLSKIIIKTIFRFSFFFSTLHEMISCAYCLTVPQSAISRKENVNSIAGL